MTPEELRNRFRRDVDDLDEDPSDQSDLLFTDDEVNEFMEEAYQQFVAETLYYHRVLELEVVQGEADITLPEEFLQTRGEKGYLVDANCSVFMQSLQPLSSIVDDYGVRSFAPGFNSTVSGTPRIFTLDLEFNTLRLYPTPEVDDTLQIPIYSKPPRIADFDAGPFVITDSMHVRHLLPGMKALAYAKQDADVYDRNTADRYAGAFDRKILDVYSERMRRRRKPQEIRYGGF